MSTDSVTQFAEAVSAVFAYDPDTGILCGRFDRIHSPAGTPIGYPDADGYLHARVFGKQYLVHRVAWLLTHGEWPPGEIDHIDGDRANNRLSNLRVASRGENCTNRRACRDLPKGAYRRGNRFSAQITFQRKVIRLGVFATAEEAHEAYLAKARELRGEFVRAA
jgi:hypothetical protein